MTLAVSHNFVSPILDQGDPTLLGPNEWNDTHAFAISPINSVVYADSLSSLSGDLDFTWVSGTGLTIGGATKPAGVLIPGVGGEHAAIGSYSMINKSYSNPGDPVNGHQFASENTLSVNDSVSGDLSGTRAAGLAPSLGVKHTGVTNMLSAAGLEQFLSANSDSTGPFLFLFGGFYEVTNFGSGNINSIFGQYNQVQSYASAGTITNMVGTLYDMFTSSGYNNTVTNVYAALSLLDMEQGTIDTVNGFANTNGFFYNCTVGTYRGFYSKRPTVSGVIPPTITNAYGLFLDDHSGIGSTASENIHSSGAASLNIFEGAVYNGWYIEGTEVSAPSAPPANGYRIFAQDSGAGKTQLMVIFNTGAAQQIAIQP